MTEAELDELISEPTPSLVRDLSAVQGDLMVLGAGGKMGPSLVRLALRAAGTPRRVYAVARFSDPSVASSLAGAGASVLAADMADPGALAALPDAPNIIFMAGQKFGTTGDEPRTWAINAWLPGAVAERYRHSRIVVFSTGNVYPMTPVDGSGPTESDPVGPVGEYAQSALARERILEYFSRRDGTPMAILRLNYAIEPRYGVLRDIADKVWKRQPIDLAMGYVNVIGQRDANAIAIRALNHCASPPFVLNVTGRPAVAVRALASALGERLGVAPVFNGAEQPTALLSNAARMQELFGPPATSLDAMLDQVASWVREGGRSLGKPTHFEERGGEY